MNRKQVVIWIILIFIIGGIAGIVFNRYLLPALADVRGFGWVSRLQATYPIVINRREEIQLNEGVNLIELTKQANTMTVSIYSAREPRRLLGNGFILSSDGLIFTAKEVVGSQNEFIVALNDGSVFQGTVRALDPKSELAVMTIAGRDLRQAQFADASNLQVGQRIIALGRTDREFTRKLASGLVTKTVMNNANPDKVLSSEVIEETVETDALINSEFVGGPVINLQGRVVGMVANSSGKILLAESMDTALRSFLEQGRIQRPRLGIKYQVIRKTAANIRQLASTGALVVDLEEGPAKAAGLQKNDLITRFNGQSVDETSFEYLLDKNYLGEVRLTVLRAGAAQEIVIKPEIK
jgi:serine protease Do